MLTLIAPKETSANSRGACASSAPWKTTPFRTSGATTVTTLRMDAIAVS
jgi:hypothetical protein